MFHELFSSASLFLSGAYTQTKAQAAGQDGFAFRMILTLNQNNRRGVGQRLFEDIDK